MFMFVGIQGIVKGISLQELLEIGLQMILVNIYYLMLWLGEQLVKVYGGLLGFIVYLGFFLIDLGGFQVMSLGYMCKISEEGVVFKNYFDGSCVELMLECSIQVQEVLGVDVIMVFDECFFYFVEWFYIEVSLDCMVCWFECCYVVKIKDDQVFFVIVQGGVYEDLCFKSLEVILFFVMFGFVVGGLVVGESKEEMYLVVVFIVGCFFENKLCYLMGVGYFEDFVVGVVLGIDMFDCVYLIWIGCFGYVLMDDGWFNFNFSVLCIQFQFIDVECDCYVCCYYICVYLVYLLRVEEMLVLCMLLLYNLWYLYWLVE